MKQQKTDQGFTIIEVVLVLAIAGLIFLMVFIALPALQRNQRDTARKNEASKVLSAITSYQSNNRGKTPTAGNLMSYLDGKMGTGGDADKVVLSSGTLVDKSAQTAPATITGASEDVIVFVMGARCDSGSTVAKGTARQAVALVILENGGDTFCQES
ncbi:prepilin-type N-terminal cleavage/methylation domain-containing protein [Candidatus Saccharibacteria bacterium]|nr:prepilin-type N-terminal cleavage/methylation domain-containing protein [Candidatus Saccharibacteria bacterium]